VHGRRFVAEHLGLMLLERARGGLEAVIGIGGAGAYARHVWLADGAAVALLLAAAVAGAAAWAIVHRDRELGVAATAAAATFALLTAVDTRLGHYLLLWYPAAAMCAGMLAARLLARWDARGGRPLAARALVVACAVALLARGLAAADFDADAAPSGPSRLLGRAAGARAAPGAPVYTLDWYAPAIGYYADRPWHMLSTVPSVAGMIGNSDPFQNARNIHAVPPWPGDRPLLVAGPREALAAAGLPVGEVVAEADGYVLAAVTE
jgi:hypothetical protein